MLKITKFGGSSCASAEQFRKVKAIIEADPSRRFVVISAAGRKNPKDNKITDLLYLCRAHVDYHVDYRPIFEIIRGRFLEIKHELGLNTPIEDELDAFAEKVPDLSVDELVSRGEYFTSRLMADFLGFPFVDAVDVVAMEFDGTFNFDKTTENLKKVLEKHDRFVMPGFYGRTPDGAVKVMTRGGSDISGSILARCLRADLYENWTDVSGFLMADPRIVKDPKNIEYRSNMSMADTLAGRALANSGAQAPHPLSEIIGGITHLPHGEALAVVFPAFVRFSTEANREKYGRVVKLFCPQAESADELYNLLVAFLKEIGLYRKLKEMGISEQEFEEVLASPILDFLPFGTREELERILKEAYE